MSSLWIDRALSLFAPPGSSDFYGLNNYTSRLVSPMDIDNLPLSEETVKKMGQSAMIGVQEDTDPQWTRWDKIIWVSEPTRQNAVNIFFKVMIKCTIAVIYKYIALQKLTTFILWDLHSSHFNLYIRMTYWSLIYIISNMITWSRFLVDNFFYGFRMACL